MENSPARIAADILIAAMEAIKISLEVIQPE